MNLNWSNRVIKYVLFVFNFLFVISGIVMIAVGVAVKSYYSDYDGFLNGSYFSLPNLLIAIGSLIFFISFFGCCGAIRESWFMIFIFAILLSVIFIMEFSAGIAGYVLRDKTASYLEETLTDSMKFYKFNQKADADTILWDKMQDTFHCCGAKGPNDWKYINPEPTTPPPSVAPTIPTEENNDTTTGNSSSTPIVTSTTVTSSSVTTTTATPATPASSAVTTNVTENKPINNTRRKRAVTEPPSKHPDDLPISCCKAVSGTTGDSSCNLKNNTTMIPYKIGCVEGFGDYLKDHAVTIGGVGIAIAFIQLFGVIFACHLAKQLKHGFYST